MFSTRVSERNRVVVAACACLAARPNPPATMIAPIETFRGTTRGQRWVYGVTALAFAAVGYWLTSTLHDRTYAFSVLTESRKHLTLHSEQAFYMSYYFDTIHAASPFHAFAGLVSDEGSEYPNVINVRGVVGCIGWGGSVVPCSGVVGLQNEVRGGVTCLPGGLVWCGVVCAVRWCGVV